MSLAPCDAWRLLGEAWRMERWRDEITSALEARANLHRVLPDTDGAGFCAGFFKGSRLRGRAALRHGLRRWTGVSEVPRLQEFHNLNWLREHGFGAPRPLLAGVHPARGLPRYQFLVTEHLAGHSTLQEWLARSESPALRSTVLSALAHDLACLHARGFVHRDLFLRNVLIDLGTETPRPIFVDAWRGGPGPGWRGPEYDLACLFLDAAALLSEQEQASLLREYALQRCSEGLPPASDWIEQLARQRARVWRREVRRRRDPLQGFWHPPTKLT